MAALAGYAAAADAGRFHLARFSADVTPPLGHPLLAGATITPPARRIDDRLQAIGFVLLTPAKPIVVASVDWCEIRNDAYDQWRQVLGEAAGTSADRVLVTSIHQHDAPLPDLEAQRILEAHKATGKIFDLDFHERAVQGVARAVREALKAPAPVSHLGLGQARIDKIASNRRYLGPDGKPRHDRGSASGGDPYKAQQPDGTIDPWLKTLSFWNGDQALCALSSYAVHPMSYWGTGWVTSDFPGLARRMRQAEDPKVLQIYASGASGNVTAGKYNDGNHANRDVLTRRLHQALAETWRATRRVPLESVHFRAAPLRLEPRESPGFTVADLQKNLSHPDPRKQCLAAMGLSWRKRADRGHVLDVPCIDFGPAQVVLVPGESYVEFQLLAQKLRPDSFVMVLGYGECAPGYIPIERAWEENDGNLRDWCWVAPGAEKAMTQALRTVLQPR